MASIAIVASWRDKTVLRDIYAPYHRCIEKHLVAVGSIEIDSGSGSLKAFYPDVMTSDIVIAPWADSVADAHRLLF